MTTKLSYTRGTLASGASPDGDLVFTASAEGTNRYGFSLNRNRWQIDNFNNNPVILWMHMDFTPPIGRGRASTDRQGLKTTVTFDRSDPFAVQIENKYRTGFLNAVSVGFDFVDAKGAPLDRWDLTAESIYNEAFYDLAEVSAVPVPADPRALVRQRHALAATFGFQDDEYDEWLRYIASQRDPRRSYYGMWDSRGLSAAPMLPAMPGFPALPGNSEVERRLARIEEVLSKLSAPPVVDPDPPADTDPPEIDPDPPADTDPPEDDPVDVEHVDEAEAASLLEALSLSGKDGK